MVEKQTSQGGHPAAASRPPPYARGLIILATTALGAVWLHYRGPLPVMLHATALPRPAPFLYSLAPFPILGMLLADLADLFMLYGAGKRTLELAFQIGVIVLISTLRVTLTIPVSGHTLLFAYFIMRRLAIRIPVHGTRPIETGAAVILYLITVYFKFTRWFAPFTLASGTLIAAGLTIVSLCVLGRNARGKV